MKTHGHYKTIAAIKQQAAIIESAVKGKKVKSKKLKQMIIRDMKQEYRLSRPKKTRML